MKGESLTDAAGPLESVSRKRLVDILNYVNFLGKSVAVSLTRLHDGSVLSLKATVEPCRGDAACLTWSENPPGDIDAGYGLNNFLIDMGSRLLIVDGTLTDMSRLGMRILLPEHCRATSRRRKERFCSAPVRTTISRNGSEATGLLQDFGGGFLKVRIAARDAGFLSMGRNELPLHVVLRREETTIYEGEAVIKRRAAHGEYLDLVVALIPSVQDESEDCREVAFNPALIAICRHPLSERIIRLHVAKASYNTIVVNEDPEHATLFRGLIISDARIDFGAGDSARCSAKVVRGEPGAWFLSILDMPLLDQRKLFSFLEKETGMSSGVSKVLDPDDLIEFFFEAGFIYPEKYAGLARSRDRLKEILSRLYIDTPSISQHFVHYNKGVIEAHVSMVRFYERAWVVHHHMATGGSGAGSAVLGQIFRYIHSYSALPSTHMDYLVCYYRPENRFPNRVFGGLARQLDTPALCSVDPFAYLYLRFEGSGGRTRDEMKRRLEPVSRDDLLELAAFYEGVSGGLTLRAFGLDAARQVRETAELDAEFRKAGLHRKKSFFSLRDGGKLKAVIMASDSDAGLNMSGLMKCIHVFVIDKKGLPFDQLMSALNGLSSLYDDLEVPVLLFPASYVSDQKAPYDKTYNLLVFHISVGKRFIEFLEMMTDRTARRRCRGVVPGRRGIEQRKL